MTHFGILCPPATGHLNPIITLGYELQNRGHHVTLFGVIDVQSKAVAAGLNFKAIGESEYPGGSVAQVLTRLGELNGLAALQYTINYYRQGATIVLRDAPKAIKEAGVQALLIDQSTLEGGTVADFLNIPFITVCNALILNPEPGVPPALTPWEYDTSWWAYLRNQVGYALLTFLGQPIGEVIAEYRKQWNLPAYSSRNDPFSKLAQVSQQPAEFEFPRDSLPQCFHFTGPYSHPASRELTAFPFEKLTGQPLIYASLGTVQNRMMWIFDRVASACVELDAQLVISLGGSGNIKSLPQLPGSPLIVEYAPQLELLKKASLTITHAGLNTTLESLSNGVPMVAIPIANDQPGVAARISWTGTGRVLSLNDLSVFRLKTAIQQVLTEDFYKKNALRLQEAIHQAGGVKRAADIIEQVVITRKPVYR
jgi:MGT family glycosyltransferase